MQFGQHLSSDPLRLQNPTSFYLGARSRAMFFTRNQPIHQSWLIWTAVVNNLRHTCNKPGSASGGRRLHLFWILLKARRNGGAERLLDDVERKQRRHAGQSQVDRE